MTLTRRSLLTSSLFLVALPAMAQQNPINIPSAIRLIEAARRQIGVTTIYDGAYEQISYPNGDIDRQRGVCTDVIIRAYRDAFSCDLQKELHEDMAKNFTAYPKTWGLASTDKNIDHRRVPNLETYFTRKKARISPTIDFDNLQSGDLVTQSVTGNRPHIMIVSDLRIKDSGLPLVIHNVGRGTREENFLTAFPATGHYRFFPS